MDAITGGLARELGPRKIRVNSVNPSVTETEGTHAAGMIGSAFETRLVAQTPLGRLGQPQDIADVVAFVASDDARWLTGERIVAGGGLRQSGLSKRFGKEPASSASPQQSAIPTDR